ncbi:protein FAR-RED IMPAIRED RESPONSE 1-like [Alnus glutinosa]|uniref:protein FAR-RED IMPAIRED RESPONSE 1-like n=1 Tax=Alnus glutinosa TaxID=3517 RepID=UPI002D771154|nr:protein FAR-RED IMPAIRED RESPONSE 1-like [Alnus glutinosa]XP_062163041.1 protein FAR-RED IMPAIRED RESPONSE 1-like [Alnus glutinosa]
MDLGNEYGDDNLLPHVPVDDDPRPQVVPQNDENEIVSDVESDDNEDQCEWKLIEEDENVEQPKKGMTFNSIEELKSYYRRFGKQRGFGVVQKKATRDKISRKEVRVTLACARQGKPAPKTSKPNPTTKTDCKAKLNAKFVETKWCVTSVTTDHNHDLSPGQARYFKCNRRLNPSVKRKIIVNDIAEIGLSQSCNSLAVEAGGYENLSFVEKDYRNFINKERYLRLGQGGAKALCDYFTKMQATNNGFYAVMDLDDESRLRNVFWADARSRASYESFGDAITFDTTYLTNRYELPFAPFVGVNHHGQSMLLGAGLLSSEDTENFVWLFQTWLECMNGRAPNAIITYQNRAMKNAIARVFPGTRHRYCLWHILKKILEKFRAHSQYDAFKSALQRCVYESQTCDDFEVGWQSLLERYNLKDNDWLRQLYDERTFWVPAYLKGEFWAGIITTQRSESINAFFDGYVRPSTTLKQFVDQYDIALRKKVENEALADFNSFNSTLSCLTFYSFEKKFQQVYTIAKFKEVQVEILGRIYCTVSLLSKEGAIYTYQVIAQVLVEDAFVKQVIYVVYFNEDKDEFEVKCTCGSFESRGILCRHVISVLAAHNITSLPSKYYLDRWRKDVKRRYTLVKSSYDSLSGNPDVQRYDNLCKCMHKLAEIAARNVDHYTKVQRHINMLTTELSGLSCEQNPPSRALPGASSTFNESIDGDDLEVESDKVHSPLKVRSK